MLRNHHIVSERSSEQKEYKLIPLAENSLCIVLVLTAEHRRFRAAGPRKRTVICRTRKRRRRKPLRRRRDARARQRSEWRR